MSASIRPSLLILIAIAVGALWPQSQPVHAAGTSSIGLGRSHSCVGSGLSSVQCWGLNLSGQLGSGSEGSSEPNPLPTDVLQEQEGAPLAGAISVTAGISYSCALIGNSGNVKCWGDNRLGQLGDAQTCGTTCATPIDVLSLAGGVVSLSAGGAHACAASDSGGVKCWGLNHFGQLGSETSDVCIIGSCSLTPVDVVGLAGNAVAVGTGLEHSCAVSDTGGIDCWGKNHLGQLGDGTTAPRVGSVSVCNVYDESSQSCTKLLSGAIAVSLGTFHTCALIEAESSEDGYGVKCWGGGTLGQLGDGICCPAGRSSATPVDVVGLTSEVAAVNVGEDHTCAVTEAGDMACWGLNDEGQLGAASAEICNIIFPCSSTPISVAGLESRAFALGVGGSHTCAATEGEGLLCWGKNDSGQLGDGTTDQRLAPTGVLIDSDGDGCTDVQELQSATGSEVDGGLRNPKSFWDFFDVPTGLPFKRNQAVDIGDIGAVAARFGATLEPALTKGEALAEALTTPIDLRTYHPAYDRTALGPNLWNAGPPNGNISIQDIGLVVAQFGHSCIAS